jgi:hypothetical protein
MNENFEIEVLCELETELLLKRIRKQINDKVSSGLRAMEMFLNPQNAPLFVYSVVKSFISEDKEIIMKLYKIFAGYEIESFDLENNYNEKKEAEFIKKVCSEWKEIIQDMNKIQKAMELGFKKDSKVNEKSYFG